MLDMTVRRNDYGRQRESFETDLPVRGLDGESSTRCSSVPRGSRTAVTP